MTAKQENKTTEKKSSMRRQFEGVAISSASDKTVMVRVDSVKIHPKYKKRYTVSRKYPVHDEANKYKEGDKVSFVECRPMSHNKRWRVID